MRRGVSALPAVPTQPELGYDSDGHPRLLRAPFPLTVDLLEDEFRDLNMVQVGQALKLGAHWWQTGEIPTGRAAAWFFGPGDARSRALVEQHARHFAPGTALATAREREVAKARRRFKLDPRPKPPGVVVRFPGGGPRS